MEEKAAHNRQINVCLCPFVILCDVSQDFSLFYNIWKLYNVNEFQTYFSSIASRLKGGGIKTKSNNDNNSEFIKSLEMF